MTYRKRIEYKKYATNTKIKLLALTIDFKISLLYVKRVSEQVSYNRPPYTLTVTPELVAQSVKALNANSGVCTFPVRRRNNRDSIRTGESLAKRMCTDRVRFPSQGGSEMESAFLLYAIQHMLFQIVAFQVHVPPIKVHSTSSESEGTTTKRCSARYRDRIAYGWLLKIIITINVPVRSRTPTPTREFLQSIGIAPSTVTNASEHSSITSDFDGSIDDQELNAILDLNNSTRKLGEKSSGVQVGIDYSLSAMNTECVTHPKPHGGTQLAMYLHICIYIYIFSFQSVRYPGLGP